MSKWQPIETAPRNGSDVLLWCGRAARETETCLFIGHWYDGLLGGGWETVDDIALRDKFEPTHWQPKIEGPK
jgi:hypothetical protein